MTNQELIEAMRAIASVLTEEIDRPGDNDDRYKALKVAEKMALKTLSMVGYEKEKA